MSRPYNLDTHVIRVLKKAIRAEQRPSRRIEQLRLFDLDKPTRYETNGLVVDDQMLFSRAVHLHSRLKAYGARRYAEILGTAMHRWEVWWVELFCGPGRLWERETDTFLPGSPVEAMTIPKPFRGGYVFADLNMACVESLRRRVTVPNAHVLCGDANGEELLEEIAGLIPRNALVVLYGDPAGLDLRWKTLDFFIERYPHLDLLLNVPLAGVVRALSAGYDEKAKYVLGHDDPNQLLEGDGPKAPFVRTWYRHQLEAAGFGYIDTEPVRLTGRSVVLYDVLIASHAALALKFFDIAFRGGRGRSALDVLA